MVITYGTRTLFKREGSHGDMRSVKTADMMLPKPFAASSIR